MHSTLSPSSLPTPSSTQLNIALISIGPQYPNKSAEYKQQLHNTIQSQIRLGSEHDINLVFIGGPEQFDLTIMNNIVLTQWDGIVIDSSIVHNNKQLPWLEYITNFIVSKTSAQLIYNKTLDDTVPSILRTYNLSNQSTNTNQLQLDRNTSEPITV